MKKLGNLFQVLYLVFAVVFAYKAYEIWNEERSRAYLFLVFVALAIMKFFFNKKYKKRFEEHYKNKEQNK